MKINDPRIPIVIAAFVLAIIVLDHFGFNIEAILRAAIPIALILYLLIAARCCIIKMHEPKVSVDIGVLKESMDRIERKLDKIENILEKVSE